MTLRAFFALGLDVAAFFLVAVGGRFPDACSDLLLPGVTPTEMAFALGVAGDARAIRGDAARAGRGEAGRPGMMGDLARCGR